MEVLYTAVMEQQIQSPEEMASYAKEWAAHIEPQENSAYIVALKGDLGAGKTTFTQGVAKALGVKEQVISPTFVIQKKYSLSSQKIERLIHIDAYRLNNPKEAHILALEELYKDPKNLILIEWPERLKDISPTETIVFKWIDSAVRSVEIV